jgi:hypothetical protein
MAKWALALSWCVLLAADQAVGQQSGSSAGALAGSARMSRIDGTRHTLPSSGDEVKRASPASIRLLFCGHEGADPPVVRDVSTLECRNCGGIWRARQDSNLRPPA